MSSDSTYPTIYNKIANIRCSDVELKNVKFIFESEINSKRRFDAIRSLTDLLRVLEKRDSLNPDKVGPLRVIAKEFQKSSVLHLLDCYNGGHSTNTSYNNNDTRYVYNREEFPVLPKIPADPKMRAYRLIATNIGQKWKDFARVLKIPEGHIDDLGSAYNNTAERVYEILRYHEQNDRLLWRSNLLSALSDARRKDLRDEVQRIFDIC
ncbi:uncharacterized protein BDFB_010838 [Asbolus verrucosus]|uniref:Death domain-containing protein n=1 Tax=Asbolus verrucosus TaxID=1661398 RepID=A0A482VKD0_ASBVE|nr:uncharacterized protein BDFB_010838 [Asbolus verrucosus]